MITCLSSAGTAVARLALVSLLLWSVLLPAAENTAIILNIEEPRAGAVYQGVANLRGWAVAPQGVERIAAYLNGAYVFDIPQGGLREDVAAHPVYGTYPGAATSGFSMALNYGDRPAGQYSLRIRAFDRLGDHRDRSVSFDTIALPNPYIVHTPEAPKVRLDPNNTVIDALGPSVFAIDGIEIEGEIYDLTLRWRDQLQGFAIEAITSMQGPVEPMEPLNDTGIDWCADETTNFLPCPVEGYPGQDAESGRDVTNGGDTDGHAGFSFTKLDGNGHSLSAGATIWMCVRDNITGLVWEVKTDDGGLRDKDNTYTWYNPDPTTNGGDPGTSGGGSCAGGIACDTHAYVQAVNAQGLCGASDWRLASRNELLSVVSNDRIFPAIDTAFFPNTIKSGIFRSSSPIGGGLAWSVIFTSGQTLNDTTSGLRYVRLVRGGQ